VKLRAQHLTDRRRDRRKFLRELVERVPQAGAETRPRKECAQARGGTVEPVAQNPPDPIGRVLPGCGALKPAVGLGKGRGAGVLGVPQMPDDTATDNRGKIHLLGETVTVFFIDQDIGGQGQTTPGEHRDQTLVAKRADQAIEGHRGDMADHRAPLQTQSAMRRQQGVAGNVRTHRAIAQDEMREDREHRFACRALHPPEGDPTETDTHIMRVASQAPSAATGCLGCELKAKGEEKGKDELAKRFAIVKQAKVGGFILEINGDGAVFTGCFGWTWHVSPPAQIVFAADGTPWG